MEMAMSKKDTYPTSKTNRRHVGEKAATIPEDFKEERAFFLGKIRFSFEPDEVNIHR